MLEKAVRGELVSAKFLRFYLVAEEVIWDNLLVVNGVLYWMKKKFKEIEGELRAKTVSKMVLNWC